MSINPSLNPAVNLYSLNAAVSASVSTNATQGQPGAGGGKKPNAAAMAAKKAQLEKINAQIEKLGGSPEAPGKGALEKAQQELAQLQSQKNGQNQTGGLTQSATQQKSMTPGSLSAMA